MSTDNTLLDDGFAPPSLEAWRELAVKSLRGTPLDKLTSHTADGLDIAPLYTGEAGAGRLFPRGEAGGWDVRSVVRAVNPEEANARVLEDLAGGANSVLLQVSEGCADGMVRTLNGVVLEAAAVALDAGWAGVEAAGWLDAAAKRSPGARLAFHLDPLSAYATIGDGPEPLGANIERAAKAAAALAAPYPLATLFMASGRAAHEAGGSEAQELGVMAASALTYAKALTAAGLPVEEAFERIVLGLAIDADVFVSIAKLRAARLIWARLTQVCGVTVTARIEARSSNRMLTRLDAWTNLLRLTAAAFAGATGGADAVVLAPFTDALGEPTAMARRQARNIQLVLMEESHLGRVADPAAGSWFVESLTEDLAREGWGVFQAIERQGGVVESLTSGFLAANIAGPREALLAGAESGHPILGVTKFRNPDETPVPVAGPLAVSTRAGPLSPMRIAAPFEEPAP